jgi:hypothetical protein
MESHQELLDLVSREYLRRLQEEASIPNVLDDAFPQQQAFIEDKARKKAIFCTRRAAKSFSLGLFMVVTAQRFPGCNIWFIGLSRESAKDIIWKDVLLVLNDKYQLGAVPNLTALTLTFPNGSVIKITGIDASEDDMKKLLGKKFKLICIDEASMYSVSIEALINMVEPAVIDQDGTICLAGTASNFPRGIFFDITTGKRKDWKIFEWTAFDNPYVSKQWGQAIERIRIDRPAYMETPQFKQWYLNQWVVDEEKLVYRFNMERNLTKDIPPLTSDGWTYVLGVDTGWEDASALVLTGYHMNNPNLFIIRIFRQSKMTFDQLTDQIEIFMKHPTQAPHKVIIDGANKQGVESMRHRSSIPFEYADKNDKATFIELCNSDLIEGRIKVLDIPENRYLWDEMASLVWMTDGDKIRYPKKEHPALQNHLCDAFLYAWRCGYHYAHKPAPKKIIKGSRQWYLEQNDPDHIWQYEKEHLIKEEESGDWPEMGNLGDLSDY